MSAKVSSFEKVTIRETSYLFFLVVWNDYETSIKKEIDKHIEKFGEEVEESAWVYKSHNKDREKVSGQVKDKFFVDNVLDDKEYERADQIINNKWNSILQKRMKEEQEPFILIIETDFASFNPLNDNWEIIWITDYVEDENSIPNIFKRIRQQLRNGENLFDFIKSMNADKISSIEITLNEIRDAVANGRLKRAISYLKGIHDVKEEAILISSRYERLQSQTRKGIINKGDEEIELNKISSSILDLVIKTEEEK